MLTLSVAVQSQAARATSQIVAPVTPLLKYALIYFLQSSILEPIKVDPLSLWLHFHA